MNIQALMVAIENGKEIYVAVDMDIETEQLPTNTSKDIKRYVDLFNDGTDDWYYIDMFGIVKDGVVECWEI